MIAHGKRLDAHNDPEGKCPVQRLQLLSRRPGKADGVLSHGSVAWQETEAVS
jgi:hypothetical protein